MPDGGRRHQCGRHRKNLSWERGLLGFGVGGEGQARGGTSSQVIKELGLRPKDNVAPKERLLLAETCSDEAFRELQVPKGMEGRRTGVGGGEWSGVQT